MPIYDVKCKTCGKEEQVFRKIKDYKDLPDCCGVQMTRIISAAYVPQEFQPYKSMLTGQIITDRGEHRRHLKAHGCTEVGNEKMEPKRDLFAEKRRAEALRQDISARLA